MKKSRVELNLFRWFMMEGNRTQKAHVQLFSDAHPSDLRKRVWNYRYVHNGRCYFSMNAPRVNTPQKALDLFKELHNYTANKEEGSC